MSEIEEGLTEDTRAPDVGDREIEVFRIIAVPRRFVFEAWTEERHLSRWMGPDGFTVTTHRFEFGPGGIWEYTMHGPDGTDYPNHVEWLALEAPARIAWLHGEKADDPRAFESEVTLADEGGRTRVTLRSVFRTKEQRDEVVAHFGAIEGGRQTLEHLDAYARRLGEGTSDA